MNTEPIGYEVYSNPGTLMRGHIDLTLSTERLYTYTKKNTINMAMCDHAHWLSYELTLCTDSAN